MLSLCKGLSFWSVGWRESFCTCRCHLRTFLRLRPSESSQTRELLLRHLARFPFTLTERGRALIPMESVRRHDGSCPKEGGHVCCIYTNLSEPLMCPFNIKSSSVSRAPGCNRLPLMLVLCAKCFQGSLYKGSFL